MVCILHKPRPPTLEHWILLLNSFWNIYNYSGNKKMIQLPYKPPKPFYDMTEEVNLPELEKLGLSPETPNGTVH